MKYLFKFFLCLSAFFLFVSNAKTQVTKTLNGTVRYESGISETKFSTPNGDVLVRLPQSMSGDVITGTVSTEPAGKTEKEKNRNLNELLKYVVNLSGTKIPLSIKPANFNWSASVDKPVRNPLELLNASGAKVAEVSLPPVLSSPAPMGGWGSNTSPVLSTPSNILVKGDVLNVYTNQQFSPGEKFVLTDSKGQQFTLTPTCLSSQQAVMNVPEGVVPGNCTIREEVTNQPLNSNNLSSAEFKMIDIDLSSPNTNLRNGQTSSVTVVCHQSSGSGITANERELFLSQQQVLTIDLRNLNPNTVSMAGGNLQRISFQVSENQQDAAPLQVTRTITGIKPGSFSVSATLHEDYNTSNDPFRPQLNVLKTPEDFNAWANALKKDLKVYAAVSYDDETGNAIQIWQIIKSNTQRAIDNMPVCTSPGQLDESKAVAYSLIRPLNIPKGVTNFWPSGLESYKAAIKTIPSGLSGYPELIDYDVIKKGLAYTDKMGKVLGYDLQNGSADAGKIITQIQREGETKENLKKLDEALSLLDARITKALNEMPDASKMLLPGGILFATKFTPPGTAKTDAEVTDIRWDKSPFAESKGKDAIAVDVHFTGDITVKKISVRVNWTDKDGKTGVADCIAKVAKDNDYKNCNKLPLLLIWPDDFTPAGINAPPEKGKLDFGKDKDGKDKFKVSALVNDQPVGGGTPENNPK